MKNRSKLYQNYSSQLLIGRIVRQRILTLILYCRRKQKKTKQRNSDRRNRANVLRACQQRVGLYTKIRTMFSKILKAEKHFSGAILKLMDPNHHICYETQICLKVILLQFDSLQIN